MSDVVRVAGCRWCGGLLSSQRNLAGAQRCLQCGKGTLLPCNVELDCGGHCVLKPRHEGDHGCGMGSHHHYVPGPKACNAVLACGGRCHLPKSHGEACLCVGDEGGPGTCPA